MDASHFGGVHWAVGRRLRVHRKAFVFFSLFQSALRPIPAVVLVASQVAGQLQTGDKDHIPDPSPY